MFQKMIPKNADFGWNWMVAFYDIKDCSEFFTVGGVDDYKCVCVCVCVCVCMCVYVCVCVGGGSDHKHIWTHFGEVYIQYN